MTLPSSCSTLVRIPCECLSGLSSPWFHVLLVWVLLHACKLLEILGIWRARGRLAKENWGKNESNTWVSFISLVMGFPAPLSNAHSHCSTFSLLFFLLLVHLKKLSLFPFSSLATLNWTCILAFLTVFLHTWTASVHSSQAVCPCFHLLCISCVWAQAGAPCSSTLALCHTCSTFWTSCAVLVLWGGCLWRSASSPGAFCPAAQFSMNRLPEQT